MLNTVAGYLSGGAAAETNAYESIATVTVGSGGAGSIAFASIPSTYKHLQLRGIARSSTVTVGIVPIYAQINSTSTNQTSHFFYGDGAAISASNSANANLIYLGYIGQDSKTASSYGAAIIDILDYTDTNKYKTFRSLAGTDFNGSGRVGAFSGMLYSNTNAISNITLYANAGADSFKQYSSFALYGIKGA